MPANRGYVGLLKLLLVAGGLLLLAAYIGNRNSGAAKKPGPAVAPATRAAQAPDREPAAAKPPPAEADDGRPKVPVDVGNARFSVSEDGLVLRIEGGVGKDFAADLQKALEANPALQRIDITSGGGYGSSGLEAARLIRMYSLKVRIKSYCASMCVGLWAAAAQREMEPDAVVGLHQWNAQCDTYPQPQRDECAYYAQFWTEHDQDYDSWLRSAGFSQRLLDLQDRTPADDIAVLNVLQLWDDGVDFDAVDASGNAMGRDDVIRFLARKYGAARAR
jgi:hypothetical protein